MTTLQKPKMKKEIAVSGYNEEHRWISVNSTIDAIQEYAEFGRISTHEFLPEHYTLTVDARFVFDEVLEWIQAHGETS